MSEENDKQLNKKQKYIERYDGCTVEREREKETEERERDRQRVAEWREITKEQSDPRLTEDLNTHADKAVFVQKRKDRRVD